MTYFNNTGEQNAMTIYQIHMRDNEQEGED